MTRLRTRLAGALATAGLAVLVAGPAHADLGGGTGGTETDGGYGAGVSRVTVTGDVDRGLVASVPSPPPLCYWVPVTTLGWEVDPSDPKAVEKYWNEEMRPYLVGHAAEGALVLDYERFAAAAKAVARGESVTFYHLEIDRSQLPGFDSGSGPSDAAGYQEAGYLNKMGCGSGTAPGRYGPILRSIDWFVTGQQPEPVVSAETLAEYAYEVMDLVDPALLWNPRIGSVGGASLVNLVTWLWVEDDAAVGQRTVTASAGGVSATVTADTDGLSVTSPAGTTECSASQARRAYAAGVAEGSACTLTFTRASRGYAAGFPVEASTVWNATWTSSTGESGELENKSQGATTDIPVVESQTLVTGVR